jgi:hypothetical protein
MRCGTVALTLESIEPGAGTFGRGFAPASTFAGGRRSALAGFGGSLSFARWAQFHTCPPSFGQTDGDRLFARAGAVFAFADMVHFLANEFPGLRRGGFALPFVASRAGYGLFLRHISFLCVRTCCVPTSHPRNGGPLCSIG